ncbi:MAG: succinyl-diaminopimelate desuccinylase [Microthrixaceae bacterium]
MNEAVAAFDLDGADHLLDLTADLVDVPSESFSEAALVERIGATLRDFEHLEVTRVGDNLVARTSLGRPNRVVLAGHTDTVPANGNGSARLEGDRLWGVGSADMKGGLAVMLALAAECTTPPVDLSFVFYAREEVAARHSGLEELLSSRPELLEGDVAVLGEPTLGQIEAGCQGSIRLRVTLRGRRAHTARAWMGSNAIHRLGALLVAIASEEPRRPEIRGCHFHEALQVVSVNGGVAGNVVPDEVTFEVVHRFAPDHSSEDAEAFLRGVLEPFIQGEDAIEVVDVAPAAMPAVDHPFIAGMIDRDGLGVEAKLGWTDVARFAGIGVPAVNLGPGDPLLAHTAQEHVERSSILGSYRVLRDAIDAGW